MTLAVTSYNITSTLCKINLVWWDVGINALHTRVARGGVCWGAWQPWTGCAALCRHSGWKGGAAHPSADHWEAGSDVSKLLGGCGKGSVTYAPNQSWHSVSPFGVGNKHAWMLGRRLLDAVYWGFWGDPIWTGSALRDYTRLNSGRIKIFGSLEIFVFEFISLSLCTSAYIYNYKACLELLLMQICSSSYLKVIKPNACCVIPTLHLLLLLA